MVDTTAQHLQLPRERIFAISAQKGLLGKIREDAGLVKKSGIDVLEKYLADEIVPMKRQILCKAVVNEIGGMMASSRASVAKRQQANQAEIGELQRPGRQEPRGGAEALGARSPPRRTPTTRRSPSTR